MHELVEKPVRLQAWINSGNEDNERLDSVLVACLFVCSSVASTGTNLSDVLLISEKARFGAGLPAENPPLRALKMKLKSVMYRILSKIQ